MAAVPMPFTRSLQAIGAWDRDLLTTVSEAGRQAMTTLDPRSSMVALLRQHGSATSWQLRAHHLLVLYGSPEADCHRLVMQAVGQGWLSLQVSPETLPGGMRDFLRRTGLLSEARLAALDRRLRAGQTLLVAPFAKDLAAIGWLSPAEAALVTRLGDVIAWRWR